MPFSISAPPQGFEAKIGIPFDSCGENQVSFGNRALQVARAYNPSAMSEHKANLVWTRNGLDFGYKNYSRNHTWTFENGATLDASAATQYLGDPNCVDPEQAFVASLSSCHLLTFLALASFQKLTIESYEDDAVGHMTKNEAGKMVISRVDLHPKIVFADGVQPSREQLEQLHHKAHEECFLANSVNCEIVTHID